MSNERTIQNDDIYGANRKSAIIPVTTDVNNTNILFAGFKCPAKLTVIGGQWNNGGVAGTVNTALTIEVLNSSASNAVVLTLTAATGNVAIGSMTGTATLNTTNGTDIAKDSLLKVKVTADAGSTCK